ncbi:origin recognition complex subunit 5-like [Sitophilus oryzae]|uniref:Origin recognition complex subunit 5 n=1 Tax=Sitophilus oryzae TaxID=7048 RepID=A0A6J2YP59_SITOR|nr:origin recognition complex subunit 5-like [Sitophilus oryzae]XP_030765138.1 origin recognition complex subunit 5-like [Sitophilus oryzae]
MASKQSALCQTFPCRENQIQQLWNLFGHVDEVFPPTVYIYGGPSTGKTAIVTKFLEILDIKHAKVNLIECYTAKILFESILDQLTGHELDLSTGAPYAKCDNFMDFIDHLQKVSEKFGLSRSVIIMDKAEELRNMESNLLPGFLRLQELTGVSVSVIFLSEILFEKYYFRLNIVEPIKIHFPQYNKDELLEIISLDFDLARELVANNFNQPIEFDRDFFRNYLNVFLSVFYRACRDLSELRHTSRNNFIKYCEPIARNEISMKNSMALWKNISPILKSSLDVLYLRVTTDDSKRPLENLAENIELPFYAKYLLIAAYLASYNSVKDDKRLFMKYHGKKTKSQHDIKRKSKVSEKLNTQMGPGIFTLDRLLAIFYSILQDKVGFNNHLLVQVSSLVELQLLSLASDNTTLDGRKYKCNVNFYCIQSLSKMVGFNIRKYLSDFSHM